MPRWTYDVVFHRMFYVTMISTAIIFTLILTNIFIDIDGFLTNKKKAFPPVPDVSNAISKVENDIPPEAAQSNVFYDENSNYDGDFSPAQRRKRSTETENILLQVRNPLMKKLLTSKLAKLLEEMDKEDPKQKEESHQDVTTETVEVTVTEGKALQKTVIREDLVHLAMHNILLQGLVGHMDLNDVFKKVHLLFRNLNENTSIDEGKVFESLAGWKETTEAAINAESSRTYEEHKLIDEILNCKNLKDVVSEHHECNHTNKTETSHRRTDKEENVIIKTIIEINDSNAKKSSRPKNIQGLIKLIYNGKPIKINELKEKSPETKESKYNRDIEETTVSSLTSSPEVTTQESTTIQNIYKQNQNPLNIVIEEYLKKHPFPNFFEDGSEIKAFESKRLKRQIKIRYFNDDKTVKPKQLHNKTKAKDDDLYIEIETHFDGKGVKGEKKKKLVKNLIEKIQKALNSDIQKPHDKERIKFIKRIQDPIDFKEHSIVLNKVVTSYEPIPERMLDPIGKTLKTHENVINRFGESWKKKVNGPSFLTVSKSVNSAEMRELNINYDAVSRNGIPKRLQQPLNAELKDEDEFTMKSDSNTGNMSLFFKDIDGTGFSIGINQYVGEPPDKDSMRIFNGIESLIREYHKSYDHEDVSNESNIDKEDNYVQRIHKISKRDADYVEDDLNEYTKGMDTDYHSNTYKMFMEGNIISDVKNDNYKNVPIVINGKLLNKELKPSEILSLANLAKRKKRALNVKKISNLKSKIKLNRYINTKAMANKKIFLKNKRNKREIQKIRIIARDHSEMPKQSDEKIFLISRENTYSDKIIRGIEDPETVIDKKTHDLNDDTFPFGDFFRMQNPEAQPIFSDNEYETKVRPNIVMSKYPHIFMDDLTNSKSEDSKDTYVNEKTTKSKQYRIKYGPKQLRANNRVEATTIASGIFAPDQKVNDFVNALLPPISRAKYKVSVKVTPKNISTNSGFKEVHTSVNKSFDQDGIRYYSLLNVSEISKVEKLNRSERKFDLRNDYGINTAQQQQMKTLLRLHKKRVDQQLNNLLRESKHLETMMKENSEINMNGTISILKADDDDNGLKEEKINKILDSVKKLEETYKTTTLLPTTEDTTVIPLENDKVKLIDTIKLNEQVTYEILKKIDTNTNILKTFLQKIGDKIDNEKQSKEKNYGDVKLDMTKDWKLYNVKDPFFSGDELKNDTVPFIYAYQQQMPIAGKNQPLASLMYHGHIHTNSVQDINHNKFMKANKKDVNNTTYFVNEMEDFKTKPGPFVSANININTTNV